MRPRPAPRSAGAAALAAALRARQFPPTCADEAAFVVRVPLQGIGIMAQFLAAGAAEALISQAAPRPPC